MNEKFISIVIVTYNDEDFITSTINSVIRQSYTDFEILVVDNGSTDATNKLIKKEFGKNPKVKLIEIPKNQGASFAANLALKQVKGDFIALLCGDDLFLPNKLKKQVEFLEKYPNIAGVFTDINFIDDYGIPIENISEVTKHLLPCARFRGDFKVINQTRHEWLKFFVNQSHALFPSTVMMRRECLDDVGLLNLLIHQISDLDLWSRICMKYEIYQIDEPLVSFRVKTKTNRINVSNNEQSSHKRSTWESTLMYKNYFHLTIEDMFKTFPELEKYRCIFKPRFKDFFICLAFMMQGAFVDEVKLQVVITRLYEMLQSDEFFEYFSESGLTIQDFIGLSGTFAFNPPQSPNDLLRSFNETLKPYRKTKIKVLFHGAGKFGTEFLNLINLSDINIIGISDGDYSKRGSLIISGGIPYRVWHYDDIKSLKFDVVIMLVEHKWAALGSLEWVKREYKLNYDIVDIFGNSTAGQCNEQSAVKNIFNKLNKHVDIVRLK